MLTKALEFEVKAVDQPPGEVSGYAAAFGNIDRSGDIIVRGAFTDTIPQFLKDGIVAYQHQWHHPIGKPLEAREDEQGLFIRARLVDTEKGREARLLMREGIIRKMSIGYDVAEAEALTEDNIEAYLGEETSAAPGDIARAVQCGRALKKLNLYEVSPVSVPANVRATITGIKDGLVIKDGVVTYPGDEGSAMARVEAACTLPLDEHGDALVAAVKQYAGRAQEIQQLRQKAGRGLSSVTRMHLKELRRELTGAVADVHRLLTAGEPPAPPADRATVLKALADFERTMAHLAGVRL